MGAKMRIVLSLVIFGVIVVAGIGAPAWADRLDLGVAGPAAGGEQVGPSTGRPKGTVQTTGGVIPITGGTQITVGSCATVTILTPQVGVPYLASVVPADGLPTGLPGTLLSCGIKIEAKGKPSAVLGAAAQVCFPIPPTQDGFAYYWDGAQWVKTTLETAAGQSCVEIPASAPNPAYAGLFEQ